MHGAMFSFWHSSAVIVLPSAGNDISVRLKLEGCPMERHRLPAAAVHPVESRRESEIRFPVRSTRHNIRARKEETT
jgi:hypothetical protein